MTDNGHGVEHTNSTCTHRNMFGTIGYNSGFHRYQLSILLFRIRINPKFRKMEYEGGGVG